MNDLNLTNLCSVEIPRITIVLCLLLNLLNNHVLQVNMAKSHLYFPPYKYQQPMVMVLLHLFSGEAAEHYSVPQWSP